MPHWEAEGSTCFVTFRLDDALPRHVVEEYREERERILRSAAEGRLTATERRLTLKLFSEKIESLLDAGAGECHLAKPGVAGMVADALRHFDGKRYRMFAWCVMPNHVHTVFRPLPGYELSRIMHSWKSFTSKEANRVLGRSGTFWEREYFDHLIRDEEEFQRIVQYVLDNPAKANLRDWPWVGTCLL
jgi:REP element-mobilizing transposase RayT